MTLWIHPAIEIRNPPKDGAAQDLIAEDIRIALRIFLHTKFEDGQWDVWIEEIEDDDS